MKRMTTETVLETLGKINWNDVANFFIVITILAIIFKLAEIIQDMIRMNKRDKIKQISMPYRKEYERLLKEEKFQEAIDYGKKYDYYLKNCYYYW